MTPEQTERKIKKDILKVITAMEKISTDTHEAIGTLLLTATAMAKGNKMSRAELFRGLQITWEMLPDQAEEDQCVNS